MDSATLDIGFVGETKADLASLARGLKLLTKSAKLTSDFAATVQQVQRHLSDAINKQSSNGFRKRPSDTTDKATAKKLTTDDDDETREKTWKFSKLIKEHKMCRLCKVKTSYNNTEILHAHYTDFHKIDPESLDKLYIILKNEKGSCLETSSPTFKRNKRTNTKRNTWTCSMCTSTFSFKANLKRHIMTLHGNKDCEYERTLAIEALAKSKYKIHFPKTVETNSSTPAKFKCCLCHKELAIIHKHYQGIHNIEYPEQIMFENGNVLVLSQIDTQGGLAPWFLKERENSKKYPTGTCKLCLITFKTPELLDKHYRCGHAIQADAFENLKLLFRAQTGAHMADQPASEVTGKRKGSSQTPDHGSEDRQEIKRRRISYNVVYDAPVNQKSEEDLENLDSEKDGVVASNVKCGRPQTAAPSDKSPLWSAEILRENSQPMVVLEDIATLFSEQHEGIMNSDKARAGIHKKSQVFTADDTNKPRHEEDERSVGSYGNTCEVTANVCEDIWTSNDSCSSSGFCSLSSFSVNVAVHDRRQYKEDPQNDRNTLDDENNKDKGKEDNATTHSNNITTTQQNNSAQQIDNENSDINNISKLNGVEKDFNRTNIFSENMENNLIRDLQNPSKEIEKDRKKCDANERSSNENISVLKTIKGRDKITAFINSVTYDGDDDLSNSKLSSRHILSKMLINLDLNDIQSHEGKPIAKLQRVKDELETIKEEVITMNHEW